MEVFDSRNSAKITVLIFAIVLYIPLIDSFIHFLPPNINLEKRQDTLIIFNIDNIYNTLHKYQDHYNQNFNGRSLLFKLYCKYKIACFNNSPLPEHVVLGKSKWLYYSVGSAENDWRGISILNQQQLIKIKENLKTLNKWFEHRNIKYYQIVVPDKDKIYPEFLPSHVKIVNSKFQIDQIVESLNGSANQLIYLKDTLLNQKKIGKLYFESDHHWNKLGAFIGYSFLMKRLKKDFPMIDPRSIEEYELEMNEKKGGDLAYMMGLQNTYIEQAPSLTLKVKSTTKELKTPIKVPKWFVNNPALYAILKINENKNLPKVLVFRDSFASAIIPFLQEDFSESLFIWDWHLDEKLINEVKPDIVIRMTVERNIDALSEGIVKN